MQSNSLNVSLLSIKNWRVLVEETRTMSCSGFIEARLTLSIVSHSYFIANSVQTLTDETSPLEFYVYD